jgi:hypothetical protein
MTEVQAKLLVWAARDPNFPEHEDAKRVCTEHSKRNRIGWFSHGQAGAL